MRSKSGWWLSAWNARQISGSPSLWRFHFSFPFCQRHSTLIIQALSYLFAYTKHFNSVVHGSTALKNAQISIFSIEGVRLPPKEPNAPWSKFWAFVGWLHAGNSISHTCMAVFKPSEALGLPMCQFFQVSGSSLPVLIFIRRWVDQINLQAEVRISGTK